MMKWKRAPPAVRLAKLSFDIIEPADAPTLSH